MMGVCAGNELHEIGMRMVADFFELSGWDSIFLGSNIPTLFVIEQLKATPTDLIAISATNANHLYDVQVLINKIKTDDALKHIKIMVGGRAFNETPNLWKKMNADGFATDAEQAVMLGELLVRGETHG
ncbi:MAG TPA: cobalamin-dependent protein [Bacilli bacterium]|nr:cobalamin-dependent protein [Bacilli bacterium]